jgi:hypothetical protein
VTVQGIVRDDATNDPITDARVTLSPQDSPTPSKEDLVVDTGESGAFALELDLATFRGYRINVGKNGYARHEETLYLSPGQAKNDMVIRMARTASISGHISTTTGQAVAGISVQIQKKNYNYDGALTYSTVATTKTNDLGDYRAYAVTPGRYYVSALGGRASILGAAFDFDYAFLQGINEIQENYPQTFFPGVSDASKAVALELKAGAEVRGIDLTMPKQNRPYSVRGRVIDSSTGQPPENVTLTLYSPGQGSSAANWYERATRTFEIPNLAPGRYAIVARLGDSGSILSEPVAGEKTATAFVDVVDSDIDNIVLSIAPSPVITGHVRVEGRLPDGMSLEGMRVSLIDAPSSGPRIMRPPEASVAADGTFKMNAPVDGEFRVLVRGLSYLKDVRFNNVSILDAPARLSSAGTLDILASVNTGTIDGRVLNEQSQRVMGAVVVAIPNTGRERTESYRPFPGSSGNFVFLGLAPGDYKLFAWQGLEPNSFYDPEVLKKYEQQGTPLHVTEGSHITLDVKVIPAETTP